MTEPAAFSYGDAAVPPGPKNILDRIKARTVATVEAETVTFPVVEREGFAVVYSRYLSEQQYDVFGMAHGKDQAKFIKAVLLAQCRSVTVDGETWLGADGLPVTFTSTELWSAFGVADGFGAIKALYLLDPDVLVTGSAVLRQCGWDLSKELEPTQP